MTSKLKCPFCEYELQENRTTNLCCPICGLVAPTKLWQTLIQSQKDLADMEEQAEFNAIMRGKDDADEIFGLKEQIEICNKREYKLTEQIAILKQDLKIARKALDKADRFFDGTIGLYKSEMHAIIKTALEQIDHIADISKMVEHKE